MSTSERHYWCPGCQQTFAAIGLTPELALCPCGVVSQHLFNATIAVYQELKPDLALIRAQLAAQRRLSVPPS